ncbi:phage head closure protein [Lacticaseibacillus suilingensis]|uniref:Phage head closure protein n=1 Tax=Lacticaseibacillus suilingensis TaxID=2799577 RepID=A0ABW4BDV0_9LACO|nr:phage head closure protein [Lacticaseibacillus suilingensis]
MLDWSEDAVLIGKTFEPDQYGNQVATVTEDTVQASKKELSMSEFYAAAQAGIRPEVELIVHAFEYDGQQTVKWNGITYSLIRTYQRNADEVELYLERKVSNIGD